MKKALLVVGLCVSVLGYSQTQTRDDAGLQGNAGAVSGFFETANPIHYPAGATGWWHLLDIRHSTTINNYAMQLAGGFSIKICISEKRIMIRRNPGHAY